MSRAGKGEPRRLAVLGSPIGHSKSPTLHAAAYAMLGLPWAYSSIEVGTDELADFVRSRGPEWRGLSLTMPLKREVLPLLEEMDDLVRLVGTANTVLFDSGRIRGFNTDVYGLVAALRALGIVTPRLVHVVGGGATAASAIVAAHELGAGRGLVSTRSPQKAGPLIGLAERLGLDLTVGGLEFGRADEQPDVVISTLPGATKLEGEFPLELRRDTPLLDVSYEPWPSPLAASWLSVGGRVSSGLEMLAHQALAQVRIFVGGDPTRELPGDAAVLEAMRASIGLTASATTA